MNESFDVFLSHNSRDKPAVRELARALQRRGLKVWLDEWELVPGRPWQEALEEIIETTQSAAVLVGQDGPGPWQDPEIRGCLAEFVSRKLPVIPVLLPGTPEEPTLPVFLKGLTWVDLREGLTEVGLDKLLWGVTGKRPDRSNIPSIPTPAAQEAVAAETQKASFEVQPAPPDRRTSASVAKKQPDHRARALWRVPAWIGILTLMGIALFLFYRYFTRPSEPKTESPPLSTPASGETGDINRSVKDEAVTSGPHPWPPSSPAPKAIYKSHGHWTLKQGKPLSFIGPGVTLSVTFSDELGGYATLRILSAGQPPIVEAVLGPGGTIPFRGRSGGYNLAVEDWNREEKTLELTIDPPI